MLCRSIIAKGFEEILSLIKGAQMVEIRIEESGLSAGEVNKLFGYHPCMLATCRPGKIKDTERKKLLKAAVDGGARWVDVEIESEKAYISEIVLYAKKRGCKVIISYHNYEYTPQSGLLRQIAARALEQGADLIKIATMVNEEDDNDRLLNLYNFSYPILAIGMGESGRCTRIAALKRGAPFTFVVAPGSHESAPGQYSEEEMIRYLITNSEE